MNTISGQAGTRFVVTDIVASTGKEATRRIKAVGGIVLIAVCTPSKGEAAEADILRGRPSAVVEARQVHLADFSGVRAFARSLRNRTRTPRIDITQGVGPQLFAAARLAAEQGAYFGPEGFAEVPWPMKRVRRPRTARRNTGVPVRLWPVAERLTDTKPVF